MDPRLTGALFGLAYLAGVAGQQKVPKRHRTPKNERSTQLVFPRYTSPPRVGRNDMCACGSGKKYKKCCLLMQRGEYRRDPAKLPKPKELDGATVTATAVAEVPQLDRQATAIALLHAGTAPREVWAYHKTGHYITEGTRVFHQPVVLEVWDAAAAEFDNAKPAQRREFLSMATQAVESPAEAT